VALKRRNVFDPSLAAPSPGARKSPPSEIAELNDNLALLELDVEFYFIGGAIFRVLLPASRGSARPRELLTPRLLTADPIGDHAARRGWGSTRLAEAVRHVVGQGGTPGRFLELTNVKVFSPPPDYALTMRLATLPDDPPARVLDDLRLMLRLLDVATADEATDVTGRYLSTGHLPPHAVDTVRAILA
jgi:hypothetical protein